MNTSMLAAVLHGAKDLRLGDYPQPPLQPGMVLLRVRRAGICGSDLHYFEHGRCGVFVPTRPFVLGHELTGEVAAAADDVTGLKIGTRVTVNPARPCGSCDYCKTGRRNLCQRTIMLGSASNTPPTDGAFAQYVRVHAEQCHVLPAEADDGLGAMMEPLAVALHALKRAGSVSGKRALVTGGGPIGLLVLITARAFGAAPLALSDIVAKRRQAASTFGADMTLDPGASDVLEKARALVGEGFDVVFEASGSPAALRQSFGLVRPGGTIIQIGTLGTDEVPLPANLLMTREISLLGSFRYGDVFDEAIRLISSGCINLKPLISQVFTLSAIHKAFALAVGKDNAIKVQIEVP